jgi:UDP-glucuronate 4-epimerase
MKILVTGAAGFIGYHLCKNLLKKKLHVYGIDNLNDYYSTQLKKDRIKILKKGNFKKYFLFKKLDIKSKNSLNNFCKKNKIDIIIHLAAQAGIRYSLKNPRDYLDNNVVGLFNLMEIARLNKIKKFIYASSSSVYGASKKAPFMESYDTSSPLQFYGATKKAGEVFLKSYNHLYNFPVICLRFFTAYGPMGRPDMAIFSFTKNILENKSIQIFNKGKMIRDFTYIDDIVDGITKCLKLKKVNFKIYNLGNQKPIKLMYLIKLLEFNLKKKAKIIFTKYKKTEMAKTHSSNKKAFVELKYKPKIKIEIGIKRFIEWYSNYYGK